MNINLQNNISLRPARSSDNDFLLSLYKSTRQDLKNFILDREVVETLIELQHQAQTSGYEKKFPNAQFFIICQLSERIGRLALDFGHNEARIIDISIIPEFRGNGYEFTIIQGVQQAAQKVFLPVSIVIPRRQPIIRQFCLSVGFTIEETHPIAERLVWIPSIQNSHL